MGIFSQEVRREFIARPDTAKGQILFKWPDTNIRKLTQLTVEQDELAVFFRDGRVQGTIQPGRVTLDSSEIPFLGILVDAASGGNLFRTELYFISTREFPNLPVRGAIDNVFDPQTNFGVGLRVFGEYSLKVVEPQSLIVNLVGTQNLSTNDKITDWMREQLLKTLRTDVVAHVVTNGWPLLGIAAHTDEIESETIAQVQRNISSYGLQIVRLGNFTITLKPEDEDKLKNFLKDVQYTKLAGGFQQYASGAAMIGAGQGLAQGAVLALTLVLTSPLLALARAGGGQSFGGGGGFSGGGGFGGGGGGFGGGGLLLPFFLFGGGGGGFIFFLFIVFALYQAYRRMSIGNPVQASNWGPAYAPMGQMRSTLTDDLTALQAKDPNFNQQIFLDRAQAAFFALQKAWVDRNLEPARLYMSDGIYHRWKNQIDAMISAHN